MSTTPRETARLAHRLNLCVVPPTEDGKKVPIVSWTKYQSERPIPSLLRQWYPDDDSRAGVGLICGTVSKNLEVLDFDDADTYQAFHDTAESLGFGDLIDRIETGYLERTPDDGVHWLYYCDEIAGNTKLASRQNGVDDKGHPKIEALIETRGEGGYIVIAPSHGPVHASGRPYQLLQGSLETIATITSQERHDLHEVARAFDRLPKPDPIREPTSTDRAGKRPGDEYNRKNTWSDLLQPYGWKAVIQRGGETFWCRPGKDRGISATTNYEDSDLLYVFSTSTIFESHRSYDRFGAYAVLEHGGDFRAAGSALGKLGYGEPLLTPSLSLSSNGHKPHEITAEDLRYLRYQDDGNAQRFALRFSSQVRYCFPLKKWFVWSGTHWRSDRSGYVFECAKITARKIYEEVALQTDDKLLEKAQKWAHSSLSNTHLDAMIKLARSIPEIVILPEDLDTDPYLFNVLNGTVDLRTGTLRPHTQEDFITKIAPVTYIERARLPLWESFLDSVTDGDRNVQDFLQRAAGYSLTGDTREEKLFFVHGPTNSGKSTFAEALKVVFGDYGLTADFETFLTRTFTGGPRPDIARLAGSRLVASIEVDEGKNLAEGLVKMMTGGDTVTARKLYQEEFEFKPQFKLWLVANHTPKVADDDDAMWRRIVRVPFDHTIPVGQRDPTIKQRLMNPEISGSAILSWLVEGCLKWQSKGLALPSEIVRATEEYRAEMDPLTDFINDVCVIDPSHWTSIRMLRNAYDDWNKTEGLSQDKTNVLSGKAFSQRLAARGLISKRAYIQGKQERGWQGIGLQGASNQVVIYDNKTD